MKRIAIFGILMISGSILISGSIIAASNIESHGLVPVIDFIFIFGILLFFVSFFTFFIIQQFGSERN